MAMSDRYLELVEELRAEAGGQEWGSQSRLAEKLGTKPTTLSRILSKDRKAGRDVIENAAAALGISMAYFDAAPGTSYRGFLTGKHERLPHRDLILPSGPSFDDIENALLRLFYEIKFEALPNEKARERCREVGEMIKSHPLFEIADTLVDPDASPEMQGVNLGMALAILRTRPREA